MATLTNTKIKDTYDGLLKTTDNDALGGTYKLITDGLGNSSNVYLGTGGNVGIGQSSPTTYKLDVNGTLQVVSGVYAGNYFYHIGDTNTFFGFPGNDTFTVTTNNEERFRVWSNGNVGIGTSSPSYKLDVNGSANINGIIIGSNGDSINKAGNLFIQTTTASDLILRTNSTERLRIDSSGRVGIGTSSPSANLQISGTSDIGLRIKSGASSLCYIDFDDADSGTPSGSIAYNNIVDAMTFATGGSNTERMRIDSSGRMGLGTSNPAALIHIVGQGGSGWTLGSRNALHLQNSNPSTTNVSNAIVLGDQTDADRWFIMNDPNANGTTANVLGIYNAGNERMRITSAGRIHFYNLLGSSATQSDVRYDTTSKEIFYNTSSERYKTEIVDLENTLDKVNSLRAVRYKDIETEQETTGLIAEEVIEIIPEVVFKKEIEGFDEPQPEGINYSDFAPFLIKAIQELKAEIETLKSQINS